MSGVILDTRARPAGNVLDARLPARTIVVAPRLPSLPKDYTDPFTGDAIVVLDCETDPACGWHAIGPRSEAKAAIAEHYRQHHASARLPSVTRLNHPRQ